MKRNKGGVEIHKFKMMGWKNTRSFERKGAEWKKREREREDSYMNMRTSPVADTGFHEEGFHSNNAREARVKNLGHAHKAVENTPIFERFREKLLALPVNRSVFDRDCS